MNNVVDLVEGRFDKWIFPAINDLYNSEGVSLGFLIMACAIDYLTGLNKGTHKDTNGADYKNFLNTYAWFVDRYNSEDIYKLVRCGLVHNFSLRDSRYVLSHKSSLKHLEKLNGRIVLKYEEFFDDIKQLKRQFFDKVRLDKDGMARLKERVEYFGFLSPVEIIVKADCPDDYGCNG